MQHAGVVAHGARCSRRLLDQRGVLLRHPIQIIHGGKDVLEAWLQEGIKKFKKD